MLNPLSAVKNGHPARLDPFDGIEGVLVLAQGGRHHAVDAVQHAHRRRGLDAVLTVEVGCTALPQLPPVLLKA